MTSKLKKVLSELITDRRQLVLKRKHNAAIRAQRDAELNEIIKKEQERCQREQV
jgi:hypothetical protein